VRHLLPALLCLTACGGTTYKLKPQAIEQVFETNSVSGGSCPVDAGPFGTISYDVKAFNEAAGIPADMGCLMPGLSFDVEAHVLEQDRSRTVGDTCVGPRGTVTLTGFVFEYDWKDKAGAAKTERLELTCPDAVIDVSAMGPDIAAKLDSCFDALTSAGAEWLRVGYNRRAAQLRVTPQGLCSAGVCFFLQISLRLRLLNASAAIDGCP
jgi:hypothetical protein